MDIIISIFAFILLISIVVAIHEGGHYYIGKLCGIKMLEFSLGFGRIIFQKRFTKDNTLFTLRAIPLGGYVKPLDKNALSEIEWNNLSEEDKNRSFELSKKWKKFLMVLAGPLSNFILAILIYIFVNMIIGVNISKPIISEIYSGGQLSKTALKPGDEIVKINNKNVVSTSEAYQYFINALLKKESLIFETKNNNLYNVSYEYTNISNMNSNDIGENLGFYFEGDKGTVFVDSLVNNSPAEKAGFKSGDEILKVNNIKINDLNKLIRTIQKNIGNELLLTVSRDNKLIDIKVVPEKFKLNNNFVGRIGINFDLKNQEKLQKIKYGLVESLDKSISKTVDSIGISLTSFKLLVTQEISIKTLSGPITIADYSGRSIKKSLYAYLNMIAAISIAIGVFNLLPIPTLDGGHLLQYMTEMIVRRDIPIKIIQKIQYIGIFLVVSILSFSLINDIIKYL